MALDAVKVRAPKRPPHPREVARALYAVGESYPSGSLERSSFFQEAALAQREAEDADKNRRSHPGKRRRRIAA
jgi:hypothetical protein